MPPLRRYLRLTAHSVLELRIYLDNPTDAHRWLITTHNPALPRVIAAVRPLVLPKLREENYGASSKGGGGKGKGGKKRGWKDVVVVEGDFEVSIFLTETSTRHSILRKEKRVKRETTPRMGSTEGKMTGTRDIPFEIGEGVVVREEEREEEEEGLFIPSLPEAGVGDPTSLTNTAPKGAKRKWRSDVIGDEDANEDDDEDTDTDTDAKKNMALDTIYDGFSIYGRILCLVVKRLGAVKGQGKDGVGQGQGQGKDGVGQGQGQARMEEWIASTQVGGGGGMDD